MPAKRKPTAKKTPAKEESVAKETVAEEETSTSEKSDAVAVGADRETVAPQQNVHEASGESETQSGSVEVVSANDAGNPIEISSVQIELAPIVESTSELPTALCTDDQGELSSPVTEGRERKASGDEIAIESGEKDEPEEREDTRHYRQDEEPKVTKEVVKAEVAQRNKRMFGSLLGHLGLAKRKLEKDSELIGKQTAVNTAAIQKNQDELQRVNDLKLNESITTKLEAKRQKLEALTAAWKSKTEPLANFIFTQVEPRIPWLPVQHTSATTALLEARKVEVCLLSIAH